MTSISTRRASNTKHESKADESVSGAVDAVREKVLTKPREPEDWLKASEVEEVAEDEDKMMYVCSRERERERAELHCTNDAYTTIVRRSVRQ